jgi:surface antigen
MTVKDTINRLKELTVSGSGLEGYLRANCISASLSISIDKVTEMGLTFQDTLDLQVFNSKLFSPGASVRYGDWFLTCDGMALGTGAAGPTISINAPSKFVTALRGPAHTGAKSWGDTPLSSWVASVAESVGMSHLVQPGLGTKSIARTAPEDGQKAETTWDVLTQQAREAGVWLFEYGSTLVFAKPSYLVRATWPRRTWPLVWNHFSDYSEGMAGMPQYSDDPGAELRESMTVKLVSPDADQARPGDAVELTGRAVGSMGGTWIIRDVGFPLHVAGVVTINCQRVIDPKVEPPRSETASTSSTSAGDSGGAATAGVAGAFDRFMAKYNGKVIDHDGAYGGQCVDLTMRYAKEVFGVNVNGNGNQWFANGAASGAFTAYAVGGAAGEPGKKGDIACWGSFYGGGYGHVAIVIADNGGSLKVLTQNPGAVNVTNLQKTGLQGYLRPKKAV